MGMQVNEVTPTKSFVLYTINVEYLSDASYVTWKYRQYRRYPVIFVRKYKTFQKRNIPGARFNSSGTSFFQTFCHPYQEIYFQEPRIPDLLPNFSITIDLRTLDTTTQAVWPLCSHAVLYISYFFSFYLLVVWIDCWHIVLTWKKKVSPLSFLFTGNKHNNIYSTYMF